MLKSKLCNPSAIYSARMPTQSPPPQQVRAHHLQHMKYIYCSTGHDLVQSLAYLWPRWLTGAHAELCAQPGRSIAWHNWANMILQVAADVVTIRHIANARDATSHNVAPATRGRNCVGNATGHGTNSTIVVSFSRDVGVMEAMADLSDYIEKLMRCTATEHALTQELHCTATEHAVSYAPTQSQHLRLLSTPFCQPATE